MPLQLKAITTGKTYDLTEEKIFGRPGGGADVTVADKEVSLRHARFFTDGQNWFIEDLKSSNGTFINGKPVHEPVQLATGMRIGLCRYEFNVAAIEPAIAEKTVIYRPDDASDDDDFAPTRVEPMPFAAQEHDRAKAQAKPAPAASPAHAAPAVAAALSDFAETTKNTLPAALAYYVKAVPKLLFNPQEFVADGIAHQSLPAMGPKILVAYALPVAVLALAMNLFMQLLLTMFIGANMIAGFTALAFSLGTGLVIGGLVLLLVCYIYHPVLGWLIGVAGGTSDEKSRSNYFVMAQTAMPIMMLGVILQTMLALISARYLSGVGVLLGAYTSLLSLFISYTWAKFFDLAKWAFIVLYMIAALIALGAFWGLLQSLRVIAGI